MRCIPSSPGSWSSLCLAYLVTALVNNGVIRWTEHGATTVAYFCIVLMFLDLMFLLEYKSVLYEKDDEGEVDGGDEK